MELKRDAAKNKLKSAKIGKEEAAENRPAVYYNLDTSTPLDLKGWLQNFGWKEIYFGLLPKFEDNGFLDNMYYLAYWVQVGNFL